MNVVRSWMKRGWDAWCPMPEVSALEGFLFRAMLAFTLLHFLPAGMDQVSQPTPVGLAHWFDLTWMADAAKYAVYRDTFLFVAVWFASGVGLAFSLPLLTALHVLPYTLFNSQGHPHHGYQILSLTLLGMSVAALAVGLRGPRRYTLWQSFAALLVIGGAARLWRAWLAAGLTKGLALPAWLQGYALAWIGLLVFVLLMAVTMHVLGRVKAAPAVSPTMDAWLLLSAQTMIAGAYFISVITKMLRSGGEWLWQSHFIALDFVKTLRQSYYSGLDAQFLREPAGVNWLMDHPMLARVLFDSGVLLEAGFLLAIGSRRLAMVLGVAGIAMHLTIERLMTLSFVTHEAMLLLCFVNVPLIVAKLAGKDAGSAGLR